MVTEVFKDLRAIAIAYEREFGLPPTSILDFITELQDEGFIIIAPKTEGN